ncbi:HD domain-containing phosphohydrolase [Syntrophorhabdus aromaticivorans]|jgi:PAS domain S-box-containing protein|nr:HD domain-containing phosphohydrolase [Syntrophorhabdus aromaticivorans]
MNDSDKTKEQLLRELSEMRERIAILERVQPGQAQTHENPVAKAEETLKLILNLSTNFIILPSDAIDDGIDDVLKVVGEFTGVDRTYIFEFQENGRLIDNIHEWCAQGVEPLIRKRQGLPVDSLPPCLDKIRSFEVINIPDIKKMQGAKPQKGNGLFYEGICSLVAVPMVYGSSLMGFLGLDSIREQRTWPEYIISLLKIVGETFANALARKKTEDSLRQSEGNYRNIFDYAVEGIFQSTPDDRYLSVNPALSRMLGFDSPEELLENITNLRRQLYVNQEDYQNIKTHLAEQGHVEGYETQFYRKDRTSIWVSINARAVRDGDGEVLYYEGFHQDITERKLAEEALRTSIASLRRTLDGTVKALATTIEMRDPYTAGHQNRVAEIACMIAEEMDLPNDRIEGIRVMGFLHDIGKIVVPAEILSKPGKLNEYEFHIIKAHSQAGYDILKGIELPWPVATAIIQHHERLDGSGYPQGLSGDEIILEARILCVADVLEAMASHRPYRPALGIEKALDEIVQRRGTVYDSEVVDACLRLFVEKGLRWE